MPRKSKKEKPELEMTGEVPPEKKPRKFTNKKGFEVDRMHADRYNIRKVNLSKKGVVTIRFFEKNANGNWDENTRKCAERPRTEFERHLQSLVTVVNRTCQFPDDYEMAMTILSVSYDTNGTDKIMSVSIDADKDLGGTRIMKIHMPATTAPYEDSVEGECLSYGCVQKLDYMWNECVMYILGERSQLKLELDEDEAALVAEEGDPAHPKRMKRGVSKQTEKAFKMEPQPEVETVTVDEED